MGLDQALTDRQPQAGAAHSLRDLAFDAVEPVEDAVKIALRDADTLVRHTNLEHRSLWLSRRDDLAAIRRVLHGVLHQIRDHLGDSARVHIHELVCFPLQQKLMPLRVPLDPPHAGSRYL